PQNIVGLKRRSETLGEHLVDPAIGRPSLPPVLGKVHTVVEDRPEHAVSEFEVIALIIGALQIDNHTDQPSFALYAGRARGFGGDLTAPTEPDHLALIKGGKHCGGEATFVVFEGRSDTV